MKGHETQECARHLMTPEQLACFLAGNGLHVEGRLLVAPEVHIVGILNPSRPSSRAILVVEEKLCWDGYEVSAWWLAFRPAWTITAPGGEVEVGETLGPDLVVCDLCNADVKLRPVPVVNGYAHCCRCFATYGFAVPGRVRPYPVHPEGLLQCSES